MTRTRVLGTCYVCGRKLFGYRVYPVPGTDPERGKAVVRDINGTRHGKCDGFTRRGAAGVTLSDA